MFVTRGLRLRWRMFTIVAQVLSHHFGICVKVSIINWSVNLFDMLVDVPDVEVIASFCCTSPGI